MISLIHSLTPQASTVYACGFISLMLVFSAAMLAGMGAYMAAIVSSKWRRGLSSPRLEHRLMICAVLLSTGAYFFILMLVSHLRDAYTLKIINAPIQWIQVFFGLITWGITIGDIYCVMFPLSIIYDNPNVFLRLFYYNIQ